MPPPRTPASVPPPRSTASSVGGFASGFGNGLVDIAKGTYDAGKSAVKGAYNIAVDPAARAQAAQQARQAAQSASRYAQQAYNDPRKALNDARGAVSGAYNNFQSARARAAAEGRLPEFYGRLSSEVAVSVVPGGALVKGARGAASLANAGRVAASTAARGTRAVAATSARSATAAAVRSTARAAPARAATRAAARPLTPAATRARTAAANPSARAARSKVSVAPCPKAAGSVRPSARTRPTIATPKPTKVKTSTKKSTKTYDRPGSFRKGVRDQVWERAKGKDGKVRDPLTKKVMSKNDKWDMGHRPGYEFRKHKESAAKRGIDRKQFLDEHNDPKKYRPELPSSNRSHRGENKTKKYLGK
jgi:predicted ribonuclease toxin of YeeF-YezG toxin-antitoxin module